ncbi:MAG TPA: universal stress protein [Pseudonocardiaceae bacterium]|nr:universal stress protein [Pseudonocardiaceae bacterium]
MGSAKVLVVGVDDSPDSRLALEYAVAEAALHGAVLRVVSAFDSAGKFGARYGVPIPVSDQQIAEKVRAETVALINDVIGTQPDPPEVEVVVQAGAVGWVLTEASADADMLIVGHRGRGEIASALLGSVGLHCVLHAQCPVTVIRPRGEPHAPG